MGGPYHPQGSTGADLAVAALAAEEHGVLALEELRRCGLSKTRIRDRCRRGHLHRVHPGVYAVGHASLTLEGKLLAAVKACAPAVLSHYSAAALWGLVEWDDRLPQVTIGADSRRTVGGVRVHRTRRLGRSERRHRRGIPVTSPERTLIDLAAQISYPRLRRAVGKALSDELVSVHSLLGAIGALSPRPGLARLRRVLARGAAPTRSVLEDLFLELIEDGGLERPRVNHALRLDGRRVVPDFLWPRLNLIVETDGARWHDHEIARADDAERQSLLEGHGYTVRRLRWAEVAEHPARVINRLTAIGVRGDRSGAARWAGRKRRSVG